jgi:hypothetical protein
MRERTLRGRRRWQPSPAKHLLDRAEQIGLAGGPPAQVDSGVGDKTNPLEWTNDLIAEAIANLFRKHADSQADSELLSF